MFLKHAYSILIKQCVKHANWSNNYDLKDLSHAKRMSTRNDFFRMNLLLIETAHSQHLIGNVMVVRVNSFAAAKE